MSVATGAARPTPTDAPLDSRRDVDLLQLSRSPEEVARPMADVNEAMLLTVLPSEALVTTRSVLQEGLPRLLPPPVL